MNMAVPGGIAVINAVSTDVHQLATDNAAVLSAQAAVTADTTKQGTDVAALVSFLTANGPQVFLDGQGGATVYAVASGQPGYSATPATVAT